VVGAVGGGGVDLLVAVLVDGEEAGGPGGDLVEIGAGSGGPGGHGGSIGGILLGGRGAGEGRRAGWGLAEKRLIR